MSFELFAAYVVATLIVLAIPGPTVMLVVSYALTQGRKTAIASILGVGLGDATAATVSLMGMGAVLAASATLFTFLKWAGAAYLLWLGFKLWNTRPANPDTEEQAQKPVTPQKVFAHSFLVTAFNPKSIMFFIAFLPHFVVPTAPAVPQLLLLGTTFVVLAVANASLYALAAAEVGHRLKKPKVLARVQKGGGALLMAAALLSLKLQRS
ncbi:LysE family translocator [Roseibium sp.]|uniref:LysE family translocator n=1 Tax=Roseibium sp. TaxID=1936156 RepID=UPI003A96C9D0